MNRHPLKRRDLIRLGAGSGVLAGAAAAFPFLQQRNGGAANAAQTATPAPGGHPSGHDAMSGHSPSATVGDVDLAGFRVDPSHFVREFDYGETTRMADGTVVREWQIGASEREIEIGRASCRERV